MLGFFGKLIRQTDETALTPVMLISLGPSVAAAVNP